MFNVKYLHKGHKINISFVLQYPHLKHKMSACVFEWFVQYPNVEHKICIFNKRINMMMIKKKEIRKNNCDKLF